MLCSVTVVALERSYSRSLVYYTIVKVGTAVLEATEITLTLFPLESETKTSPLPLSYATPRGNDATGTVATTALEASEITLAVLSFEFATKTSPLPLSYATPQGPCPTATVATTELEAYDMALTVLACKFTKRTAAMTPSN